MKKLISIPISLLMLFSCSCSSKPQKEKELDFKTLDASWECDYLKISTNSNWQENDHINGDLTMASWIWGSEDDMHFIDFSINHDPSYDKLSQAEITEHWESFKEYALTDDALKSSYEGYFVEDSFVKNGQAYLITADGNSDNKRIEFYTDSLHGTISFHSIDNDVVMSMIDTIVFY
ncbi:hypothetical protein [Ruminococcus flavefaciens]|uniref:Lipocalin-like domain-containing protein n=1 Tax=Ruminococcus flavefaciens TaxID=1265 RepID=A0A315Y4L0_RUMFL|nr:hypothetical protein [Ruminococcus flavefaciens]PWJ13969.1 hypothetical protein IE37_00900 [Ruminococcus flavefaciens]SSA43546.1 hypothetical protein SAMN02910325_00900 [Ruminococcus flavefaciens]